MLQRIGKHNRIRTRELIADTDKKTRATSAIIDMSNGLIFFPQNADEMPDCIAELMDFPNGEHDDFVDNVSYAVIEKSSSLSMILDYGRVQNPHTQEQDASQGVPHGQKQSPVEV